MNFEIRLANELEAPVICALVNAAYKELGALGLNYTAVNQDTETTLTRMRRGRTFVCAKGCEILATVTLHQENKVSTSHSLYLGQLGVKPALKRRGIGSKLMDFAEGLAAREGFSSLQLDTAKPAKHLVDWYLSRGYQIVGETHFEGKTYDSWIFEFSLNRDIFNTFSTGHPYAPEVNLLP
jgi:ribosomal protein S18 acetylase RimI-like enzyme